jgi:hypothetical protein
MKRLVRRQSGRPLRRDASPAGAAATCWDASHTAGRRRPRASAALARVRGDSVRNRVGWVSAAVEDEP